MRKISWEEFNGLHKAEPSGNGYFCACGWISGGDPGAMDRLVGHILTPHPYNNGHIMTGRYHGDPVNCQCEFYTFVKIPIGKV
jgi:hypothetical protein